MPQLRNPQGSRTSGRSAAPVKVAVGAAIHLSNGQFRISGNYLAPMDWGFRIRIVPNEPIRSEAGSGTGSLSENKKAVPR
jgi:hypothetical protein